MTTTHWILTATGRDFPLSGLPTVMPDAAPRIEDIAHALAQINRYTGHAARPYSVAEHSLLVCDIVRAKGLNAHAQLLALLHDAHEAYCGDVASPTKTVLGAAWLQFENALAHRVREAFHLRSAHAAWRKCVHAADLQALATERRDLMRHNPAKNLHWPIIDTPGAEVLPLQSIDLHSPFRTAMTWRNHRDAFLQRYAELSARCTLPPDMEPAEA